MSRGSSVSSGPLGTRSVAFWTIVAGLLALIAILLAFRTARLTSADPAAQPSPIPAPPVGQAVIAGRPEHPPLVRNHGLGTLVNRGAGLDLDSTATDWSGPLASASEVDLYIDTCCTGAPINAGRIVKVDGQPIAYKTCADSADYAHTLLGPDSVRPGDRYCLITSEGRYSEIEFRAVTDTPDPAHVPRFDRVTVYATTWQKQ